MIYSDANSERFLPAAKREPPFSSAIAIALMVVCLLLQLSSRNSFGILSNWFIPDGMTLADTFREYWHGTILAQDISWGLPINYIYFPAVWVGVLGYAIVNAVLLAIVRSWSSFPVMIALIALPYFLLATALPSKDVITLAASYLVVTGVLRRSYLMPILVSIVTFTIRDGALVIFFGFLFVWMLYRRYPSKLFLILSSMYLAAAAVDLVAQQLFGDLFIYARNRDVFESVADQTRLDFGPGVGFFIRVFANVTNMAMRPSVLDSENGLAIVGVAYFFSGIGLLYAFLLACSSVLKRVEETQLAAALLFIVSVAVVSLSPLIQPRYLLPSAAIVLSAHWRLERKVSWGLVALSISMTMIGFTTYVLMGVSLPPAAGIQLWSPF